MLKKLSKYIALFFVIANSGIPYFTMQRVFLIVSFIFSLTLYINDRQNITKDYVYIITLFLGIELIQDMVFGNLSLSMHASTFLKISAAYFIVRVLRNNIFNYFINIILFFCLVSWIFFIGEAFFNFRDLFVPGITNIFYPFQEISHAYTYSPNVLLYTFNPDTINVDNLFGNRNSGPFYEPGAFAIYIVLAFLFNLFVRKNILHRSNIVLVITLLITFSTAGYIALFSMISSYFLLNSRIKYRIPLLISTLLFMYYGYYTLSFMKEKIERNIELADVNTGSRFGSAKADIPYIIKSPLIGYGKNIENIYGKSEFNLTLMHRNNGITKLIVNYGLILFIIYMLRVYKSIMFLCILNNQNKLLSLFLFISIIALGFSQSIFNYPVFYLFLFFPKIFELDYKNRIRPYVIFQPGVQRI